jgi:hypothetical protein
MVAVHDWNVTLSLLIDRIGINDSSGIVCSACADRSVRRPVSPFPENSVVWVGEL